MRTKSYFDEVSWRYDFGMAFAPFRNIRMLLRSKTHKLLKKGSVLFVGSGTGFELDGLWGREITVIDLSAKMMSRINRNDVIKVLGDVHEMPFRDCSFDNVVAFMSFHHFARPKKALAEMKRVLRRGGKLVIVTSKKLGHHGLFKRMIRLSSGMDVKHYTEEELRAMLKPLRRVAIWHMPNTFAGHALDYEFLVVEATK